MQAVKRHENCIVGTGETCPKNQADFVRPYKSVSQTKIFAD
ncbi:MAG: hypothetical protein NZ937_06915 [Armatimonadetes bacterium]|nr:hypothetical protein [Armatimonadota bacterium]